MKINKFELEILNNLLDYDNHNFNKLKSQIKYLSLSEREFTGSGFFMYFENKSPEEFRLDNYINIIFGDLECSVEGQESKLGFLLYIKNGLISVLECYTYLVDFNFKQIKSYNFSYIGGERSIPNELL